MPSKATMTTERRGTRTIIAARVDGVNDMVPTNQAITREFHLRRTVSTMVATLFERTDVDVRIGVTQAPRELTLELPDDLDREALKTKIEAALSGAVDVLWLTDRRNRDVGVCQRQDRLRRDRHARGRPQDRFRRLTAAIAVGADVSSDR